MATFATPPPQATPRAKRGDLILIFDTQHDADIWQDRAGRGGHLWSESRCARVQAHVLGLWNDYSLAHIQEKAREARQDPNVVVVLVQP